MESKQELESGHRWVKSTVQYAAGLILVYCFSQWAQNISFFFLSVPGLDACEIRLSPETHCLRGSGHNCNGLSRELQTSLFSSNIFPLLWDSEAFSGQMRYTLSSLQWVLCLLQERCVGLEANYMYVPNLSPLSLIWVGKQGASSESTFPRWMADIKRTTACNTIVPYTISITTGLVMSRMNVS